MTAHPSAFVQKDGSSLGTTPLGARLALGALIAHDGSAALAARPGVFYDGQGAVVSGTATTGTMTYSIRAAVFANLINALVGGGVAYGALDAATTVTTTASTNRTDRIWVRQHTVSTDSGGADTDTILQFGCASGTAIPTGAMELATAAMTAGTTHTDTVTITQTHKWCVAAGAPIPVRSVTERDALTEFPGLRVYRLDTDVIELWKGADSLWHVQGASVPGQNLAHQPRRLMKRTAAAQSLSDSTTGAVSSWIADTGDDGDTTGITSNADGSFTFAYPGLYRIYFKTLFAGNATNSRVVYIYSNPTINGSAVVTAGTIRTFKQVGPNSAVGPSLDIYVELALSAADTICAAIRQDSGGALNVGSTSAGAVILTISRADD